MSLDKFRCPACGFQIFNRRVTKCEGCGCELPSELLFSRDEVTKLDAQYELGRKEREAITRRARSHDLGGSSGIGSSGDFDSDGGGNGCD